MQPAARSADQASFRNVIPLAIATVAWLGTLALASFGPGSLWDQPVLSWLALILNVVVGIAWIVVHARYLRAVDELQRKIMMDAIGVALGAGLVGGCAIAVASSSELVAFEASIALLVAFMGVVYALGVVVGTVRYR